MNISSEALTKYDRLSDRLLDCRIPPSSESISQWRSQRIRNIPGTLVWHWSKKSSIDSWEVIG